MKWDADLYQNKHSFVAEYGKALLAYIPEDNRQFILDLGCGTGELTEQLLKKSVHVTGVDSSEDMIGKAKAAHPGISFEVMDACNLKWCDSFDVIFSNAVFHWIPDQKALLGSIYKALKTGGRLICEFGAHGNVSAIREAFVSQVRHLDCTYTNPFFLPSGKDYRTLLEEAGFRIQIIKEFDRPTPLNDGELGIRNWIKQFFSNELLSFPEEVREKLLADVEHALRPQLWNGTQWVADYRRLQAVAVK